MKHSRSGSASSTGQTEIIGFVVYGHDNRSHFFVDAPNIRRCEACNEILDKFQQVPTDRGPRKRNMDISRTYDGVTVVSARFVEACAEGGIRGLHFAPLQDSRFFWAFPSRTVRLDVARQRIDFGPRCGACGLWKGATRSIPTYLLPGETFGAREFVRSDVWFAWNDGKSPLFICGVEAGAVLKDSGIRGVDLAAISNLAVD